MTNIIGIIFWRKMFLDNKALYIPCVLGSKANSYIYIVNVFSASLIDISHTYGKATLLLLQTSLT